MVGGGRFAWLVGVRFFVGVGGVDRVVGAADFFGAGVFLAARDEGLGGGGLVEVCKDEDEGRGESAAAAGGAKWASLEPFGAQGFHVGRLLPTHLDRSPISMFGVAIWSQLPKQQKCVGVLPQPNLISHNGQPLKNENPHREV